MYDKYQKLLLRNNTTSYQVAKHLGISATTFSDWKNGKSTPKIDKLRRIAEYFQVPLEYFTSDEQSEYENKKTNNGNGLENFGLCRIPVINEKYAGIQAITNEIIERYELADNIAEGCYYIRTEGDSMAGVGIMEGSLVLIRNQNYANNGQIVLCMTEGEKKASLKMFNINDNCVMLMPANDKYQPQVLDIKEFLTGHAHILGVALEVKTKL